MLSHVFIDLLLFLVIILKFNGRKVDLVVMVNYMKELTKKLKVVNFSIEDDGIANQL
jgi:hypothetical protein